MGSLPNLHELGRSQGGESGYRPGPALGHLCGGCTNALTEMERTKILHRFSGHNRITKARSNPQDPHKIVYDEVTVEGIRRRDSINSSIGATSVRRLLAVVRGGNQSGPIGRHECPVYTKRILIANLIVICFSHLFSSVPLLSFLVLQSSVTVWYDSSVSEINAYRGSYLVAGSFLIAAIMTLLSPCILRILSPGTTAAFCHGLMMIFYLSHMYNTVFVTIPVYILLGIIQGVLYCANISFLLILSHKITGLFHEEDDDGRITRRTVIIRRTARAFQGSHDIGLMLGSLLSAMIISHTFRLNNTNVLVSTNSTVESNVCTYNTSYQLPYCQNSTDYSSSNLYDSNSILDDIFDKSEDGRLCGAQACPVSSSSLNSSSIIESGFRILPEHTTNILVTVYGVMCGVAMVLAIFGLDTRRQVIYQNSMDKGSILVALRAVKESFRDIRLQMAAPLAVFIGIEQAFMYASFSKSYVVCTLGINRLNFVFLGMGLLQSVAACTLSMLLRSVRRYYVVGVGFAFHGCLFMVLIVLKPSEDDPAIFYVISAAWGVCNATWEMLSFTFLTGHYADHWEAPFINTAFFKFSGLSLSFFLHGFLCNIWKLYSIAFLMVIAVVFFAWLEIWLENVRKVKNISRL
ncbi:protein unc-93 homolog A [Diorhabda carinulata]|uniref:protein unc-93 homolog A n=1 Tax=Diorhabda carinulata TaxID=1163345 RepID=UPI0025A2DA9F|nr:protein unc-93 homolog A [Diorhabda carinulata]XP_057664272.1 protein unc-93 homolog A [Diorhabda carinulata]